MKMSRWMMAAIAAMSVGLVACGGDEKAEQKPAAKVEQPAAQPEAAKVDEAKVEAKAEEAKQPEAAQKPAEQPAQPEPAAQNEQAKVQPASPEEGKKLYEQTCKTCHDTGLLDAPKIGDKAAWAARIEKGSDTLHKHSAKGFNKMPAQAVNGVSEAQVYAAVDYMVEKSK